MAFRLIFINFSHKKTDKTPAKMGTATGEWLNVLMCFSLSAQPIPSHFRGGAQGWGERIPHARKMTPHPCSSPEMGGERLCQKKGKQMKGIYLRFHESHCHVFHVVMIIREAGGYADPPLQKSRFHPKAIVHFLRKIRCKKVRAQSFNANNVFRFLREIRC